MHHYDLTVTRAINELAGHSTLADSLFIMVTAAGVPLMVFAVAIQWWSKQNREAVRHTLVAAGLTFLVGLALNQLILMFVHQIRPYDAGLTHLLIAPSADYSFPSDHATASFAIAFAFLFHDMKRSGLIFAIAALLICFSRIYVGTHYLTDIIGGMVTAGFAAILVKACYRPGTRIDRLVISIL